MRGSRALRRIRMSSASSQDCASRWNATFDAMEEAICLLDLQGRILQANTGFTRLMELSGESVTGHRCHEIHHGTLDFLPECPFQAMLRSGKRETIQICLRDRWYDVVADPLRDQEGRLIGAVHVLRDITERKLVEDQVREQQDLYQELVNAQPAGVYRILFSEHSTPPSSHWMPNLRSHYQVQFVSDRCCQIMGLSREAFSADPSLLPAQFIPEDRESFLAERAKAVQENRGFLWEGRIGTSSGQQWVRLESFPHPIAEGQTVWTGLITDITARKRAEARLREEQSIFRDLVTTLPVGIYRLRVGPAATADAETWEHTYLTQYRVEFVSDRFCEITGLNREAFQASPGLIMEQLHPEDRAGFSERNAEAMTQKIPFQWEGRLVIAGSPRRIRFESSPRMMPDGSTLWTGVLTDITELRKVGSDYRRVYSLLRQAETIAKVGGWEIDLEAGTLYWSEEVFRIHELDPQSFTPTVESAIQFYAPEWRPVIARAVQRAIALGENFDLDLEILTATGRRLWVHATSQVVERDGRVVKVRGAFQDIAAERLAAEDLAKSHAVLAGIMESSEGPIFSLDPEYRYTSFNRAHAATMKALYGAQITLGSCLLDYQTAAEDRATAKANLDRALGGESFIQEAISGDAAHERGCFEVWHTPIRHDDGKIIGVAVTARDTTQRKRSEEALRQTRQLLLQTEALAAVGGWELDMESRLIYPTEQTFHLFDLEPRPEPLALDEVRPFFAKDWLAIATEALESCLRTREDIHFEAEVVTARDRRIWVEVRGHPVLLEGRVIRITGAVQDVTDWKLNEDALRASEEKNLALILAIPDLVFTNSLDGEYLDVHAADPGLLYLPTEAFLHQRVDEVLPAPEAARYLAAFRKAHDTNSVQDLVYTLPIGGEEKWFEARVAPSTEETVVTIVRDITERRRTETALYESERRHRTVFETSADGLVLLDRETTAILDANGAFCEMYGYSLSELRSMKATDISAEPEATQRATQGGADRVGLRWHRRKDGTVFPVEMVAKGFSEAGRIINVVSVRNITERLKEEQDLKTRVEQLQIMLELASLPDSHAGKELLREGLERIVRIAGSRVGFLHLLLEDGETLALTAWTAETMKHCTATFDTHYPVAMAGIWADAVRLRKPVIHNDYAAQPDRKGMPEGHFPLTREVVVPVVEGGKVRMILGVGNKPTPYGDLEVGQLEVVAGDLWNAYARQTVVKQLRSSEESLRATFDQALVGIVHLGFDGRILRVNKRFGDMLGFTVGELAGLEISRITHPEDQLPAGVFFQDIIREMGGSLIEERRYLGTDGAIIWVQLMSSVVSAGEGRPGYILKVAEDITERKRMESEIQHLNRDLEHRVEVRTHQLEAANQELEAFAYSVSHDLRAPLRTIGGFTEALSRDGASILSEEGHGYLKRIRAGSVRMAQLIEDLLQLSRIGRDDFEVIPLDLGAVAEQVMAKLREAEPGRTLAWQVERPIPVMGDPRLLRILLENVLGNAWKFTARAPEAWIRITARPVNGSALEVTIRDNGAGFAASQASRLFTPFQRLHKEEDFPGTGIGLAIAKRIVSRHGGLISAAGETGQGAAITFTLPRLQEGKP